MVHFNSLSNFNNHYILIIPKQAIFFWIDFAEEFSLVLDFAKALDQLKASKTVLRSELFEIILKLRKFLNFRLISGTWSEMGQQNTDWPQSLWLLRARTEHLQAGDYFLSDFLFLLGSDFDFFFSNRGRSKQGQGIGKYICQDQRYLFFIYLNSIN